MQILLRHAILHLLRLQDVAQLVQIRHPQAIPPIHRTGIDVMQTIPVDGAMSVSSQCRHGKDVQQMHNGIVIVVVVVIIVILFHISIFFIAFGINEIITIITTGISIAFMIMNPQFITIPSDNMSSIRTPIHTLHQNIIRLPLQPPAPRPPQLPLTLFHIPRRIIHPIPSTHVEDVEDAIVGKGGERTFDAALEKEEVFGEGTEFGPEAEVFGGVPEAVDCSVFDLAYELSVVPPGMTPTPNGPRTKRSLRNMRPPRQNGQETIIVSLLFVLVIVHNRLVSPKSRMDVDSFDLTGFQYDGFGGEVEFLVGAKGTAMGFLVDFLPVFLAHGDFAVYVFVFGYPNSERAKSASH
mmetsp:Transcript_22445/g.47241  ORF Transcript_22445/g.47241 Transcript_22445/m.47241 type:complete len:352 (+) Transcript_22445:158-1213(+)